LGQMKTGIFSSEGLDSEIYERNADLPVGQSA